MYFKDEIVKTPMQRLIGVLYDSTSVIDNNEEYKDVELKLPLELVVKILNNSFDVEEMFAASIFDYAFLQAELKDKAEVTNGSQYVKKFLKKNEDISSKI